MKSKKYVVFSLVVALCLLVLPGLTASGHDLPHWTQANKVPPNELMANTTALVEFKGALYTGTTAMGSYVGINTAVYRSKDGKNWQKVSPDGFGDPANNYVLWNMIVFRDKLYAATGGNLAQLWRTSNGVDWEPVETGGFGNPNNILVYHLAIYREKIYAAVQNSHMGIQLYRSATGNPGSWVKATTVFDDSQYAYQGLNGVITYNDRLYLAVQWWDASKNVVKLGVFRSQDGSTWEPITTDGFGDATNDGAASFGIYKDQLYWGTSNYGAGGQIWRTRDGKHWSRVMAGGFGDANNAVISALIPYAGDLYAITENDIAGVGVWRTGDLKNWEQVNQGGFDGPCPPDGSYSCNWGTPNDFATTLFKGDLYVGNWNPNGGEIWKMDGRH